MDPYPVTFGVEYPGPSAQPTRDVLPHLRCDPDPGGRGNDHGVLHRVRGRGRHDEHGRRRRYRRALIPTLLPILFREKYPRWWYDWNLNYQRFANRVGVYLALMDDRYPSTDEQQAVRLEYPAPRSKRDLGAGCRWSSGSSRSPTTSCSVFLYIGAVVAVIVAWFSILFTGRYPRGLFDYVEGVMRWHNRVVGAFTLVTDRYPPFRLGPNGQRAGLG